MKTLIMSFLLVLAAGAAEIKRVDDKPNQIELRNELLTVSIDLARGARAASFRYRGFDNEDVVYDYESGNGGLCKDLWTIQGWPGEFNKRLYKAEITANGPDAVTVKTWTISTGEFRNQRKDTLADLKLVKSYTLREGDRALHVKVEITNQGKKGKRPAYWSQSALDFDGQRQNNHYWRPTRHAVDMIHRGKGSEYGYWYVAVPRAGWNGVTNEKRKRGIMFLMDYNSVKQLYDNCAANTVEWMYDDVAIPAGKTWVTEITLVPTEGYAGYRHGGPQVIGHFETANTPAGLKIDHVISATSKPLTDVTVETKVVGAVDQWSVTAPTVKVDQLHFEPLTQSVLAGGIGPMPCVVQVTVTGSDSDGARRKIFYEDYVGGKAGRNLALDTLEPHDEFTPPPKQRQYLKPDVIKLAANKTPRILFVRGLWAKFQGVDQALQKLGDVEVVDAWMKRSALGETLGNFPAAYDELLSYDVIILANVSGRMLGDVGQEMLADFAKAGGGILLLSGDRTFGQAGFSNQNFLALLPATFSVNGDYGRLDQPSGLLPGADHPTAAGVSFAPTTTVLYAHRLQPTAQAVTVLKLNNNTPAVLVSNPEQPRVALVAPLPFGETQDNRRLYFRQPEWHQFLANSLTWLGAKR